MAVLKRKSAVNMEKLAEAPKSGNAIPTSGLYKVTLQAVTLDLSPWGNNQIGLYVEVDGTSKMLYSALDLGPEDTTGLESWKTDMYDKAWALFDHLAIVCDIDPNDLTETETVSLPIGKDRTDKDVEAFTEFEDKECQLWIKQDFYLNKQGEIGDNLTLKGAFNVAGFSGDEILREDEEPTRLEKSRKYMEDVKYGKGLDEETVKAWIDGGRKSSGAKPASSTKTPSFGKKKFGSK